MQTSRTYPSLNWVKYFQNHPGPCRWGKRKRDYNNLNQVFLIGENQQSPGFKEKLPTYSRLSPWCSQAWYNQMIWKTLLEYWKARIRDGRAVSLLTLARGWRPGGPDESTSQPGESLSRKGIRFSKPSVRMCVLTRDVFQFVSVFI